MFVGTKKKNWLLRIVDDEFSPVSWKMIKSGLTDLRYTEEDSFLVLTVYPDGEDEQFLQVALPKPSSGQPPVYSVETALEDKEIYLLHTKSVAELAEVIVIFNDFFRTGTLNISLFTPERYL